MDLYPWAEGCSKKWSEWHPNSNHWFTTSFLRKKVPESDAPTTDGDVTTMKTKLWGQQAAHSDVTVLKNRPGLSNQPTVTSYNPQ